MSELIFFQGDAPEGNYTRDVRHAINFYAITESGIVSYWERIRVGAKPDKHKLKCRFYVRVPDSLFRIVRRLVETGGEYNSVNDLLLTLIREWARKKTADAGTSNGRVEDDGIIKSYTVSVASEQEVVNDTVRNQCTD